MQAFEQISGFVKTLTQYNRRKTVTVHIGDLPMGSDYPIRIQSMTTTDTMDTAASVAQITRMVEAGCELVRLTAPSIKDAQNLAEIKQQLKAKGIHVPLVADIHFTPNAAEVAARIVEKVRINPGNYVDKKKFELIEYTDTAYEEELDRIREKFTPLVKICKEYGTAMRIGTNHGSLSDRIMSRYGDTPLGMVESAMEFLRICEDEHFHNIVLSMKSSNPQVMVQAYRLLVKTMNENQMYYPLHLGVTEAGDGNDGRIKSALGIGALLQDGIGDTIRVSLTEDPEFEIPVAQKLADVYMGKYTSIIDLPLSNERILEVWNPYTYSKKVSHETKNIGATHVPRVIADLSKDEPITRELLSQIGHTYDADIDKWHMSDLGADFVYAGENVIPFMLPNGLRAVYRPHVWQQVTDKVNSYPCFTIEEVASGVSTFSSSMNFIYILTTQVSDLLPDTIKDVPNPVFILINKQKHGVPNLRNALAKMHSLGLKTPVILYNKIEATDAEDAMLSHATVTGTLFIDGFADGLMLTDDKLTIAQQNETAFGTLQAARVRITKTEYISCPSCGRTLFDLQETTALIRKHTDHLKGVKIAIMGCIVNGPGEMADADYGYVGSGPGKITLYKGKEVVKKGVNKETAVEELIQLIRDDGKWLEKNE